VPNFATFAAALSTVLPQTVAPIPVAIATFIAKSKINTLVN